MIMMMRLSREEMLREWKRRKGMIPVVTSTMQVARRDSDTVDDMLMAEIDDWYAHLLATEPVLFLPQRNFADEAMVTDMGDGSVEVELPAECVRLVSVRMSGWKRDARIIRDCGSAQARMQSSRYVSGKSCDPVAVMCGRRLRLYSKCGDGRLVDLTCVAAPADGSYELERGALMGIGDL